MISDSVRLLLLRARIRPVGLTVLFGSSLLIGVAAPATVPNLQADPGIPPTRVAILLSCLVASLAVAWLRPLDPVGERLTTRAAGMVRGVPAAAVALGCLSLAWVSGGSSSSINPVGTLAGFLALALAIEPISQRLALGLPWLYALAGLVFGYRYPGVGPADLSPWAWMIGDGATTAKLAVCAGGWLVYVLAPGHRSSEV